MDHESASAAALTIAFATAAGIISQSVARTARLPGIVVLLAVGVLLGPDFAEVIQPHSLGAAMPQLVAFAVAVILFEGGMHLKLEQFRSRSTSIRRLITVGALISLVGGTLAAKLVMGWNWRTSALFGSLVIVTGPTVVTPLIRRFRVEHAVSTILEVEGVLIDAVGAVVAVVALEVALEPTGATVAMGLVGICARLAFGVLAGAIGGGVLWVFLRYRYLVAEGLENVFTLAIVWALFHASEAVLHESGIAAVTMAGLVLGNLKTPKQRHLLEFNDQLTVMLIGMLFVLLAADVRMSDVVGLGVPGLVTVGVLAWVVRPLGVVASTYGTDLNKKQKFFIAWIGPRGIIAAAVASLFASQLEIAQLPGGAELKALVFLVIASTVTLAGLTGGFMTKLLHLGVPVRGWVVLGANELGCLLAKVLSARGQTVTCIDSSVDACENAEKQGLNTICGNGLEAEARHAVQLELRAGVAAITPNDEVNLLFIQKAKQECRTGRRLAALRSARRGTTTEMVHQAGGQLLFSKSCEVDRWSAGFGMERSRRSAGRLVSRRRCVFRRARTSPWLCHSCTSGAVLRPR